MLLKWENSKVAIKFETFTLLGCETPCSTMKCSDSCHNSPRGPRIVCPAGYKIALDRVTCEDVDECKVEPPVCPNACLNTEGTYKCHDSSGNFQSLVLGVN